MRATQRSNVDFIALSQAYAGKWVAVHPATGEVLAAAGSAAEVYEAACRGGVDEPLIIRVVEDYGGYVLSAMAGLPAHLPVPLATRRLRVAH